MRSRAKVAGLPQVVSVSELTRYIKRLFDTDGMLRGLFVRGEVSNFKRHSSGHLYFTLKDEHSSIRCVMFRSNAQSLVFSPENGMMVVAAGYVTVYERDGQYQLYVEHLQPDGLGAFYLAFEQLKTRLAAEGLFDNARKRRIPALPRKVGVITSMRGAAIRDIISVSRRRFPGVKIVVADVLVQGEEAPAQIRRALDLMSRVEGVDVIIVGRGGGSIEELWAFNDEGLARAIAACPVPVISAVGHETDFTIADFVADVRAPTPSAAAVMAVPDAAEVKTRLKETLSGMALRLGRRLQSERSRLRLMTSRPPLARPIDIVLERRQRLDDAGRRLAAGIRSFVRQCASRRDVVVGRLDALSPIGVLARGYSICRRSADGAVVSRADQVDVGEDIRVTFLDGEVGGRVTWKEAGR